MLMRLFLIALSFPLLLSCGSDNEFEVQKKKQMAERAASLNAALHETAFQKATQEVLKRGRTDEDEPLPTFPVLRAGVRCQKAKTNLQVMYNPYRDLMKFTFSHSDGLTETLSNLSLNGKRVFTSEKKESKQDKLMDMHTIIRPETTLEHLSRDFTRLFPAGETASLEVSAKTEIAEPVGKKYFRYRRFRHSGWHVDLFVFSPEMALEIDKHAKSVRETAAKLKVLSRERAAANLLRGEEDEAAAAAVARFDELYGEAQSLQKELESIPHAEHLDSLKLRHEPACD